MESKRYFLGLDIGTDSVGYAATDDCYRLRKFKGEPVWGATMFDAAMLSEERRTARIARRRVDRRKQRISLRSRSAKSTRTFLYAAVKVPFLKKIQNLE